MVWTDGLVWTLGYNATWPNAVCICLPLLRFYRIVVEVMIWLSRVGRKSKGACARASRAARAARAYGASIRAMGSRIGIVRES